MSACWNAAGLAATFVVIAARPWAVIALLAAGLGLGGAAQAQLVPLGEQFQVNTYTTSFQTNPAVTGDGAGNLIVVWESTGSIQGQRYDSAGMPVGGQFQVNTYTTGEQNHPTVAADGVGNFVVVWMSYGAALDPDGSSVQGQRYDSAGMPVGGQFQVNTYTTNRQNYPAVTGTGGGSFVVVWASDGSAGSDTDSYSIHGQRYGSTGTPVGSEFQVNTYTTSHQVDPAVTADGAGNFVVVWSSYGSAGSDTVPGSISVQGQRFDSAGNLVGGQFQVNTYTTFDQRRSAVTGIGGGDFVVVWESDVSAGSDTDGVSVQGQRYDSAGVPVGGQFQVNTYTTNWQYLSAVAGDGAGNFVVVWQSGGSAGSDTDGYSIQGQRYGIGGLIRGKRILVKNPTGSESRRAVIVLGEEIATDIGPAIVGDPVANGATLRVIAKGTTTSDETFLLDAAGWTAAGTAGFKYAGPTGADGDPVKKLLLKRTPGGTALLKVLIKGNVGTQSLDVVPPDLGGAEAGIILTINGGGTYCAAFGGSPSHADARLWKIINSAIAGCLSP